MPGHRATRARRHAVLQPDRDCRPARCRCCAPRAAGSVARDTLAVRYHVETRPSVPRARCFRADIGRGLQPEVTTLPAKVAAKLRNVLVVGIEDGDAIRRAALRSIRTWRARCRQSSRRTPGAPARPRSRRRNWAARFAPGRQFRRHATCPSQSRRVSCSGSSLSNCSGRPKWLLRLPCDFRTW